MTTGDPKVSPAVPDEPEANTRPFELTPKWILYGILALGVGLAAGLLMSWVGLRP